MFLRLQRVVLLMIAAAVVCLAAAIADYHVVSDADSEEPAWQAMERVNAEVLAMYHDEDLRATEFTVGFRFKNEEDAELVNLEKIRFEGRDGFRPINLSVRSFWYDEEADFAIALLHADTIIKPSALQYRLFSSCGEVTYDGILRNEIFGFRDYVALGGTQMETSQIFELNECHYITVARWHSDTGIQTGEDGMVIYDTASYTLVPLEKESGKSLVGDGLYYSVNPSEDLTDNMSMSVRILPDEQDPNGQVEVQVKSELFVPDSVYRSDTFDEAIFHRINQETIGSSEVIITDAAGNRLAVLPY